jgi:hypothetical protein
MFEVKNILLYLFVRLLRFFSRKIVIATYVCHPHRIRQVLIRILALNLDQRVTRAYAAFHSPSIDNLIQALTPKYLMLNQI